MTNKIYDFVGPICETTDKFLTTNKFQKLNEKDYIITVSYTHLRAHET